MPPPGSQEGISPADGRKKGPPFPAWPGTGGVIEERGYGADYFPALMAA